MPWNGSGTFDLLYDFRTDLAGGPPNSFIRASRVMEQLEDMEAAINQTLNRNGENGMTQDLPLGGKKIVNLADATGPLHAPTARQIARGDAVWISNFAGSTPTAWTVSNGFGPAAYAAGLTIRGLAPETSTGALTVNYNGFGVKSVKLADGSDPPSGAIVQNRYFEMNYNGTHFILCAPTSLALVHGSGTVGSELVLKATIASPTFTGTPAAPTAAGGTNTTQLATTAFVQQEITTLRNNSAGMASGVKQPFFQAAAPTGWTIVNTHNNKALRVVSSGGGGSGGSTPFTSVFGSRTPSGSVSATTLGTGEIPFHSHGLSFGGSVYTTAGGFAFLGQGSTVVGTVSISSTDGFGGGNPHLHGLVMNAMDFAVQYVDVILATKD